MVQDGIFRAYPDLETEAIREAPALAAGALREGELLLVTSP
jgi:hypothetical protein